jgi:hypothetical protein
MYSTAGVYINIPEQFMYIYCTSIPAIFRHALLSTDENASKTYINEKLYAITKLRVVVIF